MMLLADRHDVISHVLVMEAKDELQTAISELDELLAVLEGAN